MKTDAFRDQVEYSTQMRELLAEVRHQGVEEVRRVREQLGDLRDQELGVVVDLLLSFRAVAAWADMIKLVEQMPSTLAQAPLVREQYALALNRDGRNEEAEQVLYDLIAAHGP